MKIKFRNQILSSLHSARGQSLVEYLILVALMAVATVGVVRTLSATVQVQFGRVARSLGAQSEANLESPKIRVSEVKKRDLSNFFRGSRLKSEGDSSGDSAGGDESSADN